ncbi:MAG TPA: rhodanese-like domain-containing protein [Pyrinomonadaceae bacterium]
MRLRYHFAVVMVFIAVFIAGCNSAEQTPPQIAAANKPTPVQAPPNDGVRRITVQETQEMLAKGTAVIIDVRNDAAYAQGHVKGAKLIPFTEILNHLSELPKDKMIVTYCS